MRKTWSPAAVQRCGDPNLLDLEGAVRDAPEADNGVCRKPSAADWAGLESAGLQHPVQASKNAEREPALPGRHRPATPSDRQHRHQGPLSAASCGCACRAVEGEGEWNARKHGGSKRRIWRKIHIGIDEETLEVRAVEVTTSNIGDAQMLPELLDQIPPDQGIGSVTADGAYDTRKCHDAIAARGAYAVIPPRMNAKPWKPTIAGAIARNEAINTSRYLGKAIWRRWSGYHRRSLVEAKMNCIKLLGQSLMAREFDRQVAELQVRVALLNRYTALGIPVTEAVG